MMMNLWPCAESCSPPPHPTASIHGMLLFSGTARVCLTLSLETSPSAIQISKIIISVSNAVYRASSMLLELYEVK